MSVCATCDTRLRHSEAMCLRCGTAQVGIGRTIIVAALLLVPIVLTIMVFVASSEKSRIKLLAKEHSPRLYALLTSETDRAFGTISDAKRSGLVLRQRNMVELEVDKAKWRATPSAERQRLLSALAQSAFGRELRPGEAVSVFAGTSRTPLEVKRGGAA